MCFYFSSLTMDYNFLVGSYRWSMHIADDRNVLLIQNTKKCRECSCIIWANARRTIYMKMSWFCLAKKDFVCCERINNNKNATFFFFSFCSHEKNSRIHRCVYYLMLVVYSSVIGAATVPTIQTKWFIVQKFR